MELTDIDRRLQHIETNISAVLLSLDNPDLSTALPNITGKAITDHSVWRLCARESHAIEVRGRLFPSAAHPQTAWNMVMSANLARLEDRALSVTDLTILSLAPQSTALRHIEQLEEVGLIFRERDLADARRRYVSLSDWGAELMLRYAVEVLTGGRARRTLRRTGTDWRAANPQAR